MGTAAVGNMMSIPGTSQASIVPSISETCEHGAFDFLLCSLHSEGQTYTEELRNVVKSGIAAAIVGMIYGGLPGARHARQRFIQCSQAEIYQNRVDAVVSHRTEPEHYLFLLLFLHLYRHQEPVS